MIKFLTALLTLLNHIWTEWKEGILRKQGRQEALEEVADEVQRQVDLAEYAAHTDDPDRTERLRARFDDATGE